MLQKLRNRGSRESRTGGFTIIEVMIVLAIAALILVVVLIAIPQLQRNQRNAARRDILARVKTELDNYAGNNNGRYPTADANVGTGFDTGAGFPTRYLTNVNINDPSTGSPVILDTPAAITAAPAVGTVQYVTAQICDGELPIGGSARNYAVVMGLEGGAAFCLDNR